MTLALDILISKAEASAKVETDPIKLAILNADLTAYKKTKHVLEKHETEEGDEEEPEGDDKPDDKPDDDDDEDDEDDDKKAAAQSIVQASGLTDKTVRKALYTQTLAALTSYVQPLKEELQKLGGKKSVKNALAAIQGKIKGAEGLQARVQSLEAQAKADQKDNLIRRAQNARRITKHEAATLKTKKLSFVETFLEMRPSAIVNTDGDEMPVPRFNSGVPPEMQAELDRALAGANQAIASTGDKVTKTLTAEELTAALKAANGVKMGSVI
jgi:hypothetical protein